MQLASREDHQSKASSMCNQAGEVRMSLRDSRLRQVQSRLRVRCSFAYEAEGIQWGDHRPVGHQGMEDADDVRHSDRRVPYGSPMSGRWMRESNQNRRMSVQVVRVGDRS